MSQRLDFSFLASCDSRAPKPPAESCSTQTQPVPTAESYDVDTPVIRIPAKERDIPRERTLADLAHLRIGLHTVPDFVKELEKVVGCELKSTLHEVDSEDNSARFLIHCDIQSSINDQLPYDIIDGGTFHSKDVRTDSNAHQLEDFMFIKFSNNFKNPPFVITGLNHLDTAREQYVRIKGTAEDIHKHLFQLHSRAWADTKLYAVGFSWLAVPSNQTCYQVGTLYVPEGYPVPPKMPQNIHRQIMFKYPYTSPPKVIVWINMLDSQPCHNERIAALVTDITTTGFVLNVHSWGDTHVDRVGISWFAYAAGIPGICSGSCLTERGTTAVVSFDRKFNRPPRRILVGLQKLETDKKARCRFNIVHEAVSEFGMGIRVATWGGSLIHSMGVSYVAIE